MAKGHPTHKHSRVTGRVKRRVQEAAGNALHLVTHENRQKKSRNELYPRTKRVLQHSMGQKGNIAAVVVAAAVGNADDEAALATEHVRWA